MTPLACASVLFLTNTNHKHLNECAVDGSTLYIIIGLARLHCSQTLVICHKMLFVYSNVCVFLTYQVYSVFYDFKNAVLVSRLIVFKNTCI